MIRKFGKKPGFFVGVRISHIRNSLINKHKIYSVAIFGGNGITKKSGFYEKIACSNEISRKKPDF
ncbi:MAG: hypothetical protein EAZ90_09715 [Oscillatoriales cyanobacterium]|nr:MAG: hypothetical protein EAZ94_04075 [Oscillatoriales cyanobacterium]TAE27394.1 MAG: hypothetical protein EAZ93_05525 [Oscillatoriales cyanobacterium]TAE43614.1 MAG: hypothetical protein EAZ90_09715 [Oscillatoriales cyanobacterium]TAE68363.1 MAG: hypothetical protein EAZ86_13270 [Oscillatoriales cyanobacterium]TAF88441.1 MAG: hypothetical protein EAZ49_17100 [Oscillatoriales cyanobacterium]